jgi:hypothetical protein
MKLTRRELVGGVGGILLGTALIPKDVLGMGKGPEKVMKLPWPYKKIDPKAVVAPAYAGFKTGACCYGVFSSIIDELSKSVGHPYNTLPTELLVIGQGGVADTSTICGALLGAAFATFLVTGGMAKEKRKIAYGIVHDLSAWYEQTALPIYKPEKPKMFEGEIKTSVSKSPICHVSVSRWCKASGHKAFSKARSERCGRLTADVAVKTVELLNSYADGTFKRTHKLSAAAESCRQCHDKGSVLENSRGIQECGTCHTTLSPTHPKMK